MSVGAWLAIVACVSLVVAGIGLGILLLKLDQSQRLQLIKLEAKLGRWFGLALHVDRDVKEVPSIHDVSNKLPSSEQAAAEQVPESRSDPHQ